jgi:hypothetical protein
MFPLSSAVGSVVKGAHPGNVESVFVAGRAVKRAGRLVDVDMTDLRRRAEAARDGLITRAGLSLDALRQGTFDRPTAAS